MYIQPPLDTDSGQLDAPQGDAKLEDEMEQVKSEAMEETEGDSKGITPEEAVNEELASEGTEVKVEEDDRESALD